MNSLDRQYQALLSDILANGVKKADRTGTGTVSVFGRSIRHKMSDGFPLLTTKKMHWKSIVVELLWFLKGDTNIRYLVKNGCNIWNGDAYKRYKNTPIDQLSSEDVAIVSASHRYVDHFDLEDESGQLVDFIHMIKTDDRFAEKWGELGPIYGKQWRRWSKPIDLPDFYADGGVDQISNLISDLRLNPDSRRLMVSAWNVSEIDQMVLPPCHYGFQLYTRPLSFDEKWKIAEGVYESIHNQDGSLAENVKGEEGLDVVIKTLNLPTRAVSLKWDQRSVDTFLGLPFNIASYGLLLCLIAKEVNMVPDELIGFLGDTHLYLNHLDQAKEQMSREPYALPLIDVQNGIQAALDEIKLVGYQYHPPIKAELSN